MKNVQIKGMNVELYDSIEDLPIMRFHKYNKMLLVDAGVGSDLSDFDRHIEKVIRYLNSPTPNMATVELENMRQNIYFIQSEVSPRHLAFAVLVKSINGKPRNDLSDDGLQQTMSLFKDVANSEITAHLEAVKKKIDDELRLYFPRLFDDATLKEYYDKKNHCGFDYAYRYPGMNKVLQAAGRVIRTKEDKGVILLLDDRFWDRDYQEIFPREWQDRTGCRLDTVEGAVETFWKRFT